MYLNSKTRKQTRKFPALYLRRAFAASLPNISHRRSAQIGYNGYKCSCQEELEHDLRSIFADDRTRKMINSLLVA